MTDATENMVLAQLRAIREAIGCLESGQNEIKAEPLTVREYQAAAHSDSVNRRPEKASCRY